MKQARTTTETMTTQVWKWGEDLVQTGANLFHVGMGCVATTEERARETYDRLVDRGKQYENDDGRWFARATHEVRELGTKLEQTTQKTMSATLKRTGVPSREEIQHLSRSVEELTRKVEGLASK